VGGVTLNNIKIDRSVVGVLNTGTAEKIDSAVTVLKQADPDVARAVAALTEAFMNSPNLPPERKAAATEILSIIASEAVAPKEERRGAAVRTLLQELSTYAGGVNAIVDVWTWAQPVLLTAFGG
jgi:hypothetical protein